MKVSLPHWFRQKIPDFNTLKLLQSLSDFNINTVCREAKCPNLSYCFKNKGVTFMILGRTCTRNCRFCAVEKSGQTNLGIDEEEPERIAEFAKFFALDYAVITSVSRDDLGDGGAGVFARSIAALRKVDKKIKVEVLIPDFQGRTQSLHCVLAAAPNVLAHNIETVARLYPELRPQADYGRSLEILRKSKELKLEIQTKSSIMLGLGERKEEVIAAMQDLKQNHCDGLTLGQYLSPSPKHYPVKRFLDINEFKEYRKIGLEMGFKSVLAGPLVRSSYRAEEMYTEACGAICTN